MFTKIKNHINLRRHAKMLGFPRYVRGRHISSVELVGEKARRLWEAAAVSTVSGTTVPDEFPLMRRGRCVGVYRRTNVCWEIDFKLIRIDILPEGQYD